jgi:Skp family chaperone for outer membrane proteins
MRLVILALVLLASSLARADKVAVIDLDRLYQKGGLARWLDARKQLDADRAKFRMVESPDGRSVKPDSCDGEPLGKEFCEQLRKLHSEEEARRLWSAHERSVLGPIEAEATTAMRAFARSQRIDILVPKEETMIYVSPAADITDAFIKSFNATPKPKR